MFDALLVKDPSPHTTEIGKKQWYMFFFKWFTAMLGVTPIEIFTENFNVPHITTWPEEMVRKFGVFVVLE